MMPIVSSCLTVQTLNKPSFITVKQSNSDKDYSKPEVKVLAFTQGNFSF